MGVKPHDISSAQQMKSSVSIIIPVYNASKTLDRAIRSALSQEVDSLEILCINDGSTDDSLAVLEKYAAANPRIKVVSQRNAGAGLARNRGLSLASKEFVSFLDPDDWLPDRYALGSLIALAQRHNADIAGGNIAYYSKKEQKLGRVDERAFAFEQMVSYASCQDAFFFQRFVFRRRLLSDNEIVFPRYRRYQDPPFLAQAMIAAGQFVSSPRISYCYTVDYAHVMWNEEKCCDYYAGVADLLRLSRMEQLTVLHAKTFRDLKSLQVLKAASSIRSREVLTALNEAIEAIDVDLLGDSHDVSNFKRLVRLCIEDDNALIRALLRFRFTLHCEKTKASNIIWATSPSLALRLKKAKAILR